MRLSLSVEETNRLRQKLGLKLIDTGNLSFEGASENGPPSSKQYEKLVSKINRAESIALQSSGQNCPPVSSADSSSKPEKTTDSWLEQMKKNKERFRNQQSEINFSSTQAASSEPSPIAKYPSSASNSESSLEESKNTEMKNLASIHPIVSSSILSRENTNEDNSESNKDTDKPPEAIFIDPIALSEETRLENQTPRTQKAVFKPKKIKNTSRSRKRALEMPNSVSSNVDTAIGEFDNILMHSRLSRKRRTIENDTYEPQIFKSTDSKTGVQINSIESMLTLFDPQTQTGKELEQHPVSRIQQASGGEGTIDEHEAEVGSISTHMNGVATILDELRQGSRIPEKKNGISRSSRDWARKISSKRKARELELRKVEKQYINLPLKEREQALELHKQKIIQENAMEARELEANYHPEVEIEHKDHTGKLLSTKNAFKELSRSFHGTSTKS